MGFTASMAATAASRFAVLASSLTTMSVSPSAPPMMLSAEEAASEDAAAEVLSLAAGAESAEEPQAASNMAQHRITGISFFIGQVLLLL